MNAAIRMAAVIPARMGSSRFPGKALLSVRGLPMIEHVRRRTVLSGVFSDVVVATCDQEIAQVVTRYGGRVLMTSPDHPGALDRVAEAMRSLECTHVMNVQGDEILVMPDDLRRMVDVVTRQPEILAWNAASTLEAAWELSDPSIVKLFISKTGRVLFCARRWPEETFAEPSRTAIVKSIGMMVFAPSFLNQFVGLPRTPLEQATGMDQLRILEHDLVLHTVVFQHGYPTINEPREVAMVEACLSNDPRQQAVLDDVLAGAGVGG